MKKKVIAAGHICLDITPTFPSRKVKNLSDVLIPGKLLQVGEADVHTGGSVANTGLGMKVLGADVTLMGKIGKDAFGDMVLSILKQYDAEKGMLISDQEATSYSVVLAVPGNDRIFLHHSGANHTFCTSDIPDVALEDAALFHFGYPTLMKSMYENVGEELVRLMKRMKEKEIATSLDMSAVDAESKAGQVDWESILERVIPYVDFFVPSVEELCFMLDRKRFEQWQQRAQGRDVTEILDVEEDVKPLAEKCMQLGAKVLLIKCGAPGMYYYTAKEETLEKVGRRVQLDIKGWAGKRGFERSYIPDKIVSGTGAGDTSIAAFLTAMLENYSLKESLQLATATGASCVTAFDALSGLKPFEELKEKIKQGWEKTEVEWKEV
jgi:Sugar kinases, ribokinase family